MAELAPRELIASLRRPKLIFTQQFLDDPVKFATDDRFFTETKLSELDLINVTQRDLAEFAVIDIGDVDAQYYPIGMYTLDYDRQDIARKIDKSITALIEL